MSIIEAGDLVAAAASSTGTGQITYAIGVVLYNTSEYDWAVSWNDLAEISYSKIFSYSSLVMWRNEFIGLSNRAGCLPNLPLCRG